MRSELTKNAIENDISAIKFKIARINEGIFDHQVDLIRANVLASVLIAYISVLVNTVKKHGALSLSVILVEEVAAVNAAFTPLIKCHWDSFLQIQNHWANGRKSPMSAPTSKCKSDK
jgi:ribosomal protein L11 methylase PrmA